MLYSYTETPNLNTYEAEAAELWQQKTLNTLM